MNIIEHVILLHSCDYYKKILTKIKGATDEGNSQIEIWHLGQNEIEVAVSS